MVSEKEVDAIIGAFLNRLKKEKIKFLFPENGKNKESVTVFINEEEDIVFEDRYNDNIYKISTIGEIKDWLYYYGMHEEYYGEISKHAYNRIVSLFGLGAYIE